jgi:squalene-associated FAD-dependent desaturase
MPSTIAIAGGGLAGLAAACALADSGHRVTLYERRPYLGGRASSYEHPGTGEVVDNCQHVLFRVCTNLIEFYRRIGVEDKIRWFEDMTFLEPGGRSTVMHASPLPAPLHTAPSFLRFPFLNAKDKFVISRAIAALTLTRQPDTGKSFLDFCRDRSQTENAIHRFWETILVSALSESLDRISTSYAAQVVRESMKSLEARHMGVPTLPLTELYNRAGDYLRARNGQIQFRTALENFTADQSQVKIRVAGKEEHFDYLIVALPFEAAAKVLPETPESAPLRESLSHFEPSSITGIHLWFDREITQLDHAVLLDRTVQWMFNKSRLLAGRDRKNAEMDDAKDHVIPNGAAGAVRNLLWNPSTIAADRHNREAHDSAAGTYLELVVSASKNLIDKSRSEIVDLALKEVREFFPAARAATLTKSTVIKEIYATYSPRPGIDAHRPPQTTPWPRVFLAGDWTATGWPATMEGAVRSGYLAAEALTRAAALTDPALPAKKFLVPDLPASGLMRIFGK